VSAFNVREVNRDNADALMALDVAAGQRRFVAPVVRSLAQAAYESAARPLGLYDGDTPVGFLLLYDARQDKDEPAEQLYVWRLMVDARYQRLGLGRSAMAWVIDEARRLGLREVGLSHVMQPGHAGPFYEKLGFRYTGVVKDGEHKMLLHLDPT
jgi:GNAT superfamily N-acetyltransferase